MQRTVTRATKAKGGNKYIVDTSIQYEKLKDPNFLKSNGIDNSSDIQSLFYILYEFRMGFIRAAIQYYSLSAKYRDTAPAIARLANDFSSRTNKNGLLILSLISRISKGKPGSKTIQDELDIIEAAIFHASCVFDIDISYLQGSFASNPVVKFDINSSDEYEDFIDVCNRNRILPMEAFWQANVETLDKLLSNLPAYESKNNQCKKDYTSMRKKLQAIKANYANSAKVTINAGIGDAVIFTDCSRNFIFLTTDCLAKVFESLDSSLKVEKLKPALPSSIFSAIP